MLYFYSKCLKIRQSVQIILYNYYIQAMSYYKITTKLIKNIVDFVVVVI